MSRLQALRTLMKEKGLGAVYITDECNLRYLSGFAFTDGYLLITEAIALLVTDRRYSEAAEATAVDFLTVVPEDRHAHLDEVMEQAGSTVLGFEGAHLTFAAYHALKKRHPGLSFVDLGDALAALRTVKGPEELSMIARAQSITELAYERTLSLLTPAMTEKEVAAELEYQMRKAGAEGFAFETIAVCAEASSLPHGTPRDVPLRPGFLTMDFGAKWQGYCSDMTRTVVIGRADAAMRRLYHTVRQAQETVLSSLCAGVDAAEMDGAARRILERHYPGGFAHSLGHGVGLYIHEAPTLSPRAAGRALRVGEVVTVEPGVYLPGRYGCRIEDMVAIEENGIHNFTKARKDLIEIL